MRMNGLDIQHATGGQWHGAMPDEVEAIVTDTRDFRSGQTFLALRGPNFDGHRFAASIADKALALIGDAQGVKLWKDLAVKQLEVADTLVALGDIAHAWRMQLQDTTVVAISGSYGKTSLRSILETGFTSLGLKVAATRANLNNLIGVPQTLLAVPADADIAVIECGISEAGEMERLAAIVEPDIAILTGITAAHSEGLGGLAGVVQEKALLLQGASKDGWCALGKGVSELLQENNIQLSASGISVESETAVNWQLNGQELVLSWQGQQTSMQLALPARHWAENIAFAATIMLRYLNDQGEKVTLADVVTSLATWQPPAGRMRQCKGRAGSLVLDDCYNANPVSMQAAIDTLRSIDGSRVAILGDMAELGESSLEAHAGIDITGLDAVYLIGSRMQPLAEKHPDAQWFASTEQAVAELSGKSFDENDTVLVKASRSMALEAVVNILCEEEVADAV
ncbi:UDP-N-acetylmuramoyl-tripeptide--D-alanyl-D-alanine ligase [Mariprofundus micogutta]|uniref:UDP-N-acetylmuramoyl-tripeptide--D-alanyl-D-alanine ligase n=1 Tax=Mariprofundus micogutta TaxID=1921010 RepID=A0A1L8CKV3_9PROT|nr:UDP-N-acetylmuramoyl-tripeptide--D-alanyl-D-alanine ligase [Mariprofundus micogutta]GAV19536.1 UDP-N-acetylmuramoyl-tripeptide--D-alanyl-D-alanine ligase [Mariprofundus micogutta]